MSCHVWVYSTSLPEFYSLDVMKNELFVTGIVSSQNMIVRNGVQYE